jgi:hypothetical protein
MATPVPDKSGWLLERHAPITASTRPSPRSDRDSGTSPVCHCSSAASPGPAAKDGTSNLYCARTMGRDATRIMSLTGSQPERTIPSI